MSDHDFSTLYQDIDFVPDWYVARTHHRRDRQRQVMLIVLMCTGMAVLASTLQRRAGGLTVWRDALKQQVDALQGAETELVKLQVGKAELTRQILLHRQLDLPISYSYVTGTLAALTPPEVSLNELGVETKRVRRQTTAASRRPSGKAGQTESAERYDHTISVRIVGINAPELREANGAAARDALARLIEGRTVRLEFPGPRKRDHFGRLLAQVYNGEMDIGAEMLKTELAVPFRH